MTQTGTSNHSSPKLRLAQIILEAKGIDLSEWLLEQRKTKSLEQIARELYVETDLEVSVTIQTIGRWLDDLEEAT